MSQKMYVNLKSELTYIKFYHEKCGNKVFRTRTECDCPAPYNRRNAIICTDPSLENVELVAIRCKNCTKKHGGE